MAVFDFFDGQALVRPTVTVEQAERIATERFGITGTARELGSNQDRNFLIDGEDGCFLLKVDNSAFSEGELAAQDAALTHLAERGIRVPVPIPGTDGNLRQSWPGDDGALSVRLLSYLGGAPLASDPDFTPEQVAGLGELAGNVARELADFEADGLDRKLQWDLRRAGEVIDLLLDSVTDADRSERVKTAAGDASQRLAAVSGGLRVQAIHGDITDDNVLGDRSNGRLIPSSVIDFGDLANGWLVAELAVTISSILHHVGGEARAALAAASAFDQVVPLTDGEIAALWPLVVLRGAVLVVSGEHQVSLEAGNDYAAERVEHEWQLFEASLSLDWDEAERTIRALLNRPRATGCRLLAGDVELLDFSVTSPLLNEGRWLEPEIEWELAEDALSRASVAGAPYGQYRLTRSSVLSSSEPSTLALAWDLFATAGAEAFAPGDADVLVVTDDTVHLSAGTTELRISGLAPSVSVGDRLSFGQPIGVLADQRGGVGRLRVQQVAAGQANVPAFVPPSAAVRWMPVVTDPAEAIGLDSQQNPFDADHELERRSRIFASAQERYYLRPPQIERGWKEHLIGADGRAYLDLVNNVAVIGHSHPRQMSAVAEQLALLNTNSRFLYRALADLSERLVELAPDPSLDTVLLVNSGTEAVDLALRLAQVHTGRRRVVALREAYHGWSMGADAVTTSAYDNPTALANRPDWVEVADVPNTFRGRYASAEAYLADLREQLGELTDAPAAFICEPILGNAGGVLLPDGYLSGVYEEIRSRGGLCIADEVQVGYGRLGHHFWGVQQQGVVPDIITIAKAMGNGYPIGAVITRKEIAESLSREGNFFSSAGGSPVSCVAALAVLDVIRDDELQTNAATVGDHLVTRLRELANRHPIVGAVHGMGLYLGIELVRDRETLEPATLETEAVCERMLELGIIVQPTSERQNVLKVKPPLCLTLDGADFFIDALDEVLTRG